MDLGLRGKTALVAAASDGLGRAVACALAAEGANVAVFSRSEPRIRAAAEAVEQRAASGSAVLPLVGSLTAPEDIHRVVEDTLTSFGKVDILYNNAGGPKPGVFDTLTDEDWENAFQLNLMSAVRLTRACLPSMRQSQWGRIITGTSGAVKQPIERLMLSTSIRSAVTAWSKSLADEVAQDGITVNCLAPGRIATGRLDELDADAAKEQGQSFEEVRAERRARIPLGRYGKTEEFAAAAAFLASEQAAYITGVTFLVDGGQFRGTY